MQKYIKNRYILGFTVMVIGLSAALPTGAFNFYGPGSGIYYTGFVNTRNGVGFSWPWAFVDAPSTQTSFASFNARPYQSYTVQSYTASPFIPFHYYQAPQISPLNQAPSFFPLAPQTLRWGQTIQFTVQAHDPDSPYLRWSAVDLPPGAIFNDYTHVFSWTPTVFQIGRYAVKFRVSDASAPYIEMNVSITVTDQNGFLPYTACGAGPGPYFFNFTPPLQVNAGELYAYQAIATSGNNNQVSYRVIEGPKGFHIDEKTGYIIWLVAFNQSGATYPVRIAVYNGQCELSQNFTITVPI